MFRSIRIIFSKIIKRLGFQINKVAAWYVPVASKYFYYRWGEALINRSLGESEMPNLCMKWLFLSPTIPKGKYNVLVGGLTEITKFE